MIPALQSSACLHLVFSQELPDVCAVSYIKKRKKERNESFKCSLRGRLTLLKCQRGFPEACLVSTAGSALSLDRCQAFLGWMLLPNKCTGHLPANKHIKRCDEIWKVNEERIKENRGGRRWSLFWTAERTGRRSPHVKSIPRSFLLSPNVVES